MNRHWITTVVLLLGSLASAADDRGEPTSTYIHGTVDVVISTREGFVLASDSRLSMSNGTHSDDGQKIFTVGTRAACASAGTLAFQVADGGFRLSDALGTYLVTLDKQSNQREISAEDIASMLGLGFESLRRLADASNTQPQSVTAKVSAVSISPTGVPQWITLQFPAQTITGSSTVTTGPPQYVRSPSTPLHFDFEALGSGSLIVQQLLSLDKPSADVQGSRRSILQKFYSAKRDNKLDDWTLADGVELARALIETVIQVAPPSYGIGGPVDILTVTKEGVKWMQKKEFLPQPPPYIMRSVGGSYRDTGFSLDGVECLRCIFDNVRFKYEGKLDTELVAPHLQHSCSLTITSAAKQKQPEVVRRLKSALAQCQLTEQ